MDTRFEPADGGRDTALRDTGLSARPDPGMDRFARLVARVLDAPVALVALVTSDRQILPGLVGLGDPWARTRTTPLTHSLCHQVTFSGEPLVLNDTAAHQRWCTHPAVVDLEVAAYAAMPLTDEEGHILGSLCAVDTAPRAWTEAQLDDLADLAAACSAELRLRILSRRMAHAHAVAQDASQRADAHAERTRIALGRSQLLLRAAEDLTDTTSLAEVRRQVRELVTSDLKPSYVGLVLVEDGRLRRLTDVDDDPAGAVERHYETYHLDDAWPTARAARDNTTIVIQNTDELVAGGYSDQAVAAWTRLGLCSAICVPLPGTRIPLGTLVIGWDTNHELDVVERAVVTALAGYTARAVERALFVDRQIAVAHQFQQAMLTELPEVDGLDIAALYRPAAAGELVGGDWYDAYSLPAVKSGPNSSTLGGVAVTIGDITGHDIEAATLMGQVRSMLRQADLDHLGADPATAVRALEHANRALRIGASGTLVHGHLRPMRSGHWELVWSNAGHPPPLLRSPDGTVDRLDAAHEILLHPSLVPQRRTTHRTLLPPGSTLLLYTDGLVDQRGHDIDAGIARTAEWITDHPEYSLPQLLDSIADQVGGPHPEDDIAFLAVRTPDAHNQ
ncbi:hypothetical protein ALI144C_00420 [Actinosynnema sp. ALI-1.44]|nr:hypothetical protein ALI144C_00420 [Actinosynnema sp. ALI-1.44]